MDVSRRRFFMFLGAAAASPIIHHIIPNKMIFDMAMPVKSYTIDDLNRITQKYLIPQLTDSIFRPSPLFEKLKKSPYYGDQLLDTHIYDTIDFKEAILING